MATFATWFERGPFTIAGVQPTGLKLYHYAAGTTDLLDMYTDRAKTSTDTQPLVADANGMFGSFGDGLYKMVVKSSDDVTTHYTWDNVNVTDSDVTGEGAAIASASTLVLGKDGDMFHVSGDTTITKISGTQSRVTLIFDAVLILKNGPELVMNGGIDFTTSVNGIKEFLNDGGVPNVWREIAVSLDTVVTDIKIKKLAPVLRLLDTTDATEYGVRVTGSDMHLSKNTGTEGSPSWTNFALYDFGTTTLAITGSLSVTGGIVQPTITDLSNMTHDHTTAAQGGVLGNAGSGNDAAFTSDAIGTGLVNTTATTTLTVVATAKVLVVASCYVDSSNTTNTADSVCSLAISRDGTNIASTPMNPLGTENKDIGVTVTDVDDPPAGSTVYTAAVVSSVVGPSTVTLVNVRISAYTIA